MLVIILMGGKVSNDSQTLVAAKDVWVLGRPWKVTCSNAVNVEHSQAYEKARATLDLSCIEHWYQVYIDAITMVMTLEVIMEFQAKSSNLRLELGQQYSHQSSILVSRKPVPILKAV
jgi:hypothetical protein